MVNRRISRRPLFAALVVVVLGGIYAAGTVGHSAAARAQVPNSGRAAVTSAVRVCPGPGSAGVTASAVALTAAPQSATRGKAVVTDLVPGGSTAVGPIVADAARPRMLQITPVKTAPALPKNLQSGQPGSSAAVSTQAGRGGVVVTATGAMAQGLSVEQSSPNGLVTEACASPGTSFWFLGPGQAEAGTIELYLMNPDSQPADAQVSVLTDVTKGAPVLGDADNGINVPPHAMVVQSLSKLLQSSKVMALSVSTNVGQVVAAVRESSSGSDDGSWLPATEAPARNLVIPGMTHDSGPRDLYIAVPGTAAAEVKISAVTNKGSYQPTGGTGIDLLGGSVTSIALPALSGVAGAIKITSNVPVTASLLLPGGPAGTAGAVAVACGPIHEQGVLADNQARSAQILLSAPARAATVRITEATSKQAAGGLPGTTVQVKAGTSEVIQLKPPVGSKASQFSVIVTPLAGSGPVYASRIISADGVVQSILPVPSSLTWVPLPAVQGSLARIADQSSPG